ncbi:MAG: hypothetical protein CFE23_16585 [Flavobacterium sp. BFFFF1]|uniref:hypothetical protein n=1 Tax=Flavobacterium sp. BFFFF1 TaxID=2015557 RepID=UPI000BC7D582|nr:hypothetical protein [Flavobacterium sp. BFFFF1]OYU78878.1 MAG: hypothetical protein CFE23_16585 [Flavobacterium sp. BFFFF1]
MSLLKTFPEVELFFESDKFSQEELLSFIQEIEKKYTDERLRRSAHTLIRLKILQFEIAGTKTPSKNNIVNGETATKKEKGVHSLIQGLRHKSIENIALKLQWTSSQILILLKQKGISKNLESLLDENEFKIVAEMFYSRIMGIRRNEKNKIPKKMIKKDKPKSLDKKNDVYSKIESIGLGKVIYIRKK